MDYVYEVGQHEMWIDEQCKATAGIRSHRGFVSMIEGVLGEKMEKNVGIMVVRKWISV